MAAGLEGDRRAGFVDGLGISTILRGERRRGVAGGQLPGIRIPWAVIPRPGIEARGTRGMAPGVNVNEDSHSGVFLESFYKLLIIKA
jgi:hypothetical protein